MITFDEAINYTLGKGFDLVKDEVVAGNRRAILEKRNALRKKRLILTADNDGTVYMDTGPEVFRLGFMKSRTRFPDSAWSRIRTSSHF